MVELWVTSEVSIEVCLDEEVMTVHLIQVQSRFNHLLKLAEVEHQLLHTGNSQ